MAKIVQSGKIVDEEEKKAMKRYYKSGKNLIKKGIYEFNNMIPPEFQDNVKA